jgi:hypothetical protein
MLSISPVVGGGNKQNGETVMNALMDITNTVDDVEGLLTETFGSPAPPKDEILRHKWLESEKAGRDIGLPAALQDWSVKHYQPWKTAHVTTRRRDLGVFVSALDEDDLRTRGWRYFTITAR